MARSVRTSKRVWTRTINNHTGRAIVGCVGYRLIYQKLLAHYPPDMAFLRQFSFEPAGKFSCASISILNICIIKSYIDSHFLTSLHFFSRDNLHSGCLE